MRTAEKNEYLHKINFGLKDHNETLNKYSNYKQEEFKTFISDNSFYIQEHFNLLAKSIKLKLNIPSISTLDLNSKKDIRLLKTYINSYTYDLNKKFISDSLLNANDNMIKNFTIKFYILNYNKINLIMKSVLIDISTE